MTDSGDPTRASALRLRRLLLLLTIPMLEQRSFLDRIADHFQAPE